MIQEIKNSRDLNFTTEKEPNLLCTTSQRPVQRNDELVCRLETAAASVGWLEGAAL